MILKNAEYQQTCLRKVFTTILYETSFADSGSYTRFGWKDRARAEPNLMEDLIPLLRKKAKGQEISGLEVYDE